MSPAARRAATGLAGAAAMIAVITVVSRVLGFGRWLAQAYAVGAGSIGDAYNTANTLPNVLFEVAAGGALAGALVPCSPHRWHAAHARTSTRPSRGRSGGPSSSSFRLHCCWRC